MAVEGPLWWQIEHGRYRNTTLKKGPVTWKMMDTIIRKAQCS